MSKYITRYETLLSIIEIFKPQSIVEVGTWNGKNAVRMLHAAHKFYERVSYVGYDLFEDATPDDDEKEFNVKEHIPMEKVKRLIEKMCPFADVTLVKGNTLDTLQKTIADFAFIDGGHSVETILSDYQALAGCNLIVFDDYYSPAPNGKMPDISKIGCNLVVQDLNYYPVPTNDAVRDERGGEEVGRNGFAVVIGGTNGKA